MKRCTAIELMIVVNQPAARAHGLVYRRHRPGTKLQLQQFETHRFTPKIKVLQDGSLCPKNSTPATEQAEVGQMVQVIHRVMPFSASLLRNLPSHLC